MLLPCCIFCCCCCCCCRCTRTATFDGLSVKTLCIVAADSIHMYRHTNTMQVYISYSFIFVCTATFSLSLSFSPTNTQCFKYKFYVLDTLKWILLCTYTRTCSVCCCCSRRDTICDTYILYLCIHAVIKYVGKMFTIRCTECFQVACVWREWDVMCTQHRCLCGMS